MAQELRVTIFYEGTDDSPAFWSEVRRIFQEFLEENPELLLTSPVPQDTIEISRNGKGRKGDVQTR